MAVDGSSSYRDIVTNICRAKELSINRKFFAVKEASWTFGLST